MRKVLKVVYPSEKNIFVKRLKKAKVGNDPLQLESNEAGDPTDDSPGPPDLSVSHQHRHPGDDWAEGIIHTLQRPGPSSMFLNSYIYIMGFCVYGVPLPPLRGQHTVLSHPRWLPTSGLTEFAVCWGGAGFEPRTTDLQSGVLPLSHLSSCIEAPLLLH
jgi:hypothetical protein